MTYLALIAVFAGLAVAAVLLVRRRLPRGAVRALVVAFAALAILTVVFDSIMIATGLFTYGEGTTIGVLLWLAPIEDLAYPLVALLVVAAVSALVPFREPRQ